MVRPSAVGCTPMVSRGRADLHMHTTESDGWPSPYELVDYARATRLNVIAVTDHDTIEGALRAADYVAGSSSRLDVVVGEEVSSRDGHIVALFIERRIRPGMSAAATVHAIHDQGGLAVAVPPFWRTQTPARRARVHGVGWLAAGGGRQGGAATPPAACGWDGDRRRGPAHRASGSCRRTRTPPPLGGGGGGARGRGRAGGAITETIPASTGTSIRCLWRPLSS